jgi:DNA repair/transcription protein MET18/MMS19
MTSSSSQEQYTATYTIRSFFEHIVVLYKVCFLVQSLPQGERRLVYTILDYFLSDYTQAVKEMGSEFVLGYIQTMDGEKDPRNLVIALNSVTRIVLSLPFEVLAEDLFEVVACYFPIDFTPVRGAVCHPQPQTSLLVPAS